MRAKGVRLKIRYTQGFQTQTAQLKVPEALQDGITLFEAAKTLFPRFKLDQAVRLVGVSAFDLVPQTGRSQMGLFQQNDSQGKREQLEQLSDAIETKFGEGIIRSTFNEPSS